MKRFLLFTILTIIMESLNAQETSQWVGISNNSDPLVRHNEAFMGALCQYISSYQVSVKSDGVKTVMKAKGSCRFHILSDVTDGERETITISVGSGTLINYMYTDILSEETDNETRAETVLIVTYGADSKNYKKRSQHEYRSLYITYEKESGKKETSDFTYKCENINIYE